MAIKLKPCPFCGGAAQFFEERIFIMGNASLIGVKCTKCGGAYMTSDKDKCPNDVFKAWNQRAGEVTINQYGEGGKVFGHVDTLTINY